MKNLLKLKFIVFGFILLSFPTACYAQTNNAPNNDLQVVESATYEGKVIEVLSENLDSNNQIIQKVKVHITSGKISNQDIVIDNNISQNSTQNHYKTGDDVFVSYTKLDSGSEVYYITDYIRTGSIITLLVIFVFLALIISFKKGLLALLSLVLSFAILFVIVLPRMKSGADPVAMAIIGVILIIPIIFYLSHGLNKQTTVAIIGTAIALVITGFLSNIFIALAHLTGASSDEAMFLQTIGSNSYNMKGLLLAGMLIGALGVLDDITVSQTSIVYQLNELRNDLTIGELFSRAITVGKDHISSVINTLALVYTGASLPLLILFLNNPKPINDILSFEILSTELVRTLVGSIGLMLSVPITTYLACIVIKRFPHKLNEQDTSEELNPEVN
jgi:uncharacterized membrane protein